MPSQLLSDRIPAVVPLWAEGMALVEWGLLRYSPTYWGVGGGLLVLVHDGDRAQNSPSVFIDFKVNYTQGSEAEYLSEGDIEIVDDFPVFDVSNSETDLTTFQIGVVFTF